MLSIASSSFLIAITQREQVAQIFGKPIYVITDIAILPLSSQTEANRAITAANTSPASESTSSDTETDLSDSDESISPPNDTEPETPVESNHDQQQAPSSTSVAKDVIANRGQYGRFAANWFSRQGWGVDKAASHPPALSKQDGHSKTADSTTEGDAAAAANLPELKEEAPGQEQARDVEQIMTDSSITEALPKILRRTKMILTSGSFFFSYDFDLTRRFALLNGTAKAPSREALDPLVSRYCH